MFQVPVPECSTVYEERCVEPTTEVCDPVTRISHHNRWGKIRVIGDNKNFIKEASYQTKISGDLMID